MTSYQVRMNPSARSALVAPMADSAEFPDTAPGSSRRRLQASAVARPTPTPDHGLFSPATRRAALILAYPELEAVCDRIGFSGSMSLEEWCTPPDWALLTLAREAGAPPPAPTYDWSHAEISELVVDLLEQHHHHMRNELQRLRILIHQFDLRHLELADLHITATFNEFSANQTARLDYRKTVVFPCCIVIDAINRGHAWGNSASNDVIDAFRLMAEQQSDAGKELAHLRELFSGVSDQVVDPDLAVIGEGLTRMATDLAEQTLKERDFLAPAVIRVEDQILARQHSR